MSVGGNCLVYQDGSSFKAKYKFRPYFYAATKDKMEIDVEAYLRRRYENDIIDIEIVDKENLDLVIPCPKFKCQDFTSGVKINMKESLYNAFGNGIATEKASFA
ncbi:hypothetical protein Drorol1_Dr00008058 [Drosera rotundifolia]